MRPDSSATDVFSEEQKHTPADANLFKCVLCSLSIWVWWMVPERLEVHYVHSIHSVCRRGSAFPIKTPAPD